MPASSGSPVRQTFDHASVKAVAALLAVVAAWAGYESLDGTAAPDVPPTAVRGSGRALERLLPVRLAPHRNNDGDSFQVRHGDRNFELRLYFADCPEKYLSDQHANQRERVADQARDLGLTVEETVDLGLAAREKVLALLSRAPFTVHTSWERVYDGDRFYGFVELPDPDRPGSTVYLSEWLVRHGLARIHTKGATTPDGRSAREFEAHLRSVERDARERRVGAWGS